MNLNDKVIHIDFMASRDNDVQYDFLQFAIDVCQMVTAAGKIIDRVAWQNSDNTRYEIDFHDDSSWFQIVSSLHTYPSNIDFVYVRVDNDEFYSYDEMLEFFRDLMDGRAEI